MKRALKTIAILLVVITVFSCFASCSSKGKTLMELDGTKMSVNTFMLFLSRMKGNLASAYHYGTEALKTDFWDSVRDASGTTNNDYYTDLVLEDAKTYLAALYLFDELGLKLPDSYIEEIDTKMDDLVDLDGKGSKSALNDVLSQYGVNYNILRDAYIIEAKISYLRDHLFGENGSKIASEYVEEYYQQNYVRFKHVFLYTYKMVYESDENGDSIYFTSDNRIAYDTSKTVKKDADGNTVKDINGDTVYINEETGKIAYDNQKGARKNVYDNAGNAVTEKYTDDEIIAVLDKAELIMDKAVEGNFTLFEALVESENEDPGMDQYPGGYYMTETSDYSSPKVIEALFDMEVGDIEMITSDYGVHIVMKYELEEGGYDLKANSDFFIGSSSGNLVFMNDLINGLFADYLEKYIDKIEVNEALLEGVDIKSVGANYDF